MRMKPRDAAIAIRKRVNPCQTVMSGCQRHKLLSCENFLARINLLEAVHELRQRLVMGGVMLANIHFKSSQYPGFDLVVPPAEVSATMQLRWQSTIKLTVQPANELRRMNGQVGFVLQAIKHQPLDLDMSLIQMLIRTLIGIL